MESIEIKGFLTIEHAHLEIKKINILIGAQAQGKSVIAKLVYFFKHFFPEIFIPSIEKLKTKRELDKKTLAEFELIFPRYTWTDQEFSIVYLRANYELSITRIKVNDKYVLKFTYSQELVKLHQKLKRQFKLALSDQKEFFSEESEHWKPPVPTRKEFFFHDNIFEEIKKSSFNTLLDSAIFIPAGRSFFAALQNNIFSFLSNDINIDPLIKKFGSQYEQCKRLHLVYKSDPFKQHNVDYVSLNKVGQLMSKILAGEYFYEEGQDWIVDNGKFTNLMHTSSGQQESLPMLLVLKIRSIFFKHMDYATFFIEEPEAHLFPSSQKQIISLIATIYNATGKSFFITTHSPYILTALNNLVVGQDAYDKAKASANTEQLNKLAEVLPVDELIHLEDVSAYTLNNGLVESIVDRDDRLIGANLLDAVSDEFDIAFGVAIDVLYGAS